MTVIEKLQMNVDQANSDFVAIKNKIVEKGVEVANGTRTAEYANKVDEVYEAGRKSQYDEFWDAYQNNGGDYQYAFCNVGWNDVTFKPKYDIVLKAGYGGTSTFQLCAATNIAEVLERQGVRLDTSQCGFFSSMFNRAKSIRLPVIDFSRSHEYSGSLSQVFYSASVETIDKIIINENTLFASNTFQNCANLKNLIIEGTLAQNGFNVQWSKKLSKASWISIVTALSATTTGLSITGSLESVNTAFETSAGAKDGSTSAEWLNLITTKSNWTINLV